MKLKFWIFGIKHSIIHGIKNVFTVGVHPTHTIKCNKCGKQLILNNPRHENTDKDI